MFGYIHRLMYVAITKCIRLKECNFSIVNDCAIVLVCHLDKLYSQPSLYSHSLVKQLFVLIDVHLFVITFHESKGHKLRIKAPSKNLEFSNAVKVEVDVRSVIEFLGWWYESLKSQDSSNSLIHSRRINEIVFTVTKCIAL